MFIRILIHKLIFRREMLDKVKTKLIYLKSRIIKNKIHKLRINN
jgi:hypothetical protein